MNAFGPIIILSAQTISVPHGIIDRNNYNKINLICSNEKYVNKGIIP